MSTTTASRARATLESALAELNALVAFANGEGDTPPSISGLTDKGRALLSRQGGRDIARSWATVFADTVDIVNRFHDEDLNTRKANDHEVEQVAAATLRVTAALTTRLNSLG